MNRSSTGPSLPAFVRPRWSNTSFFVIICFSFKVFKFPHFPHFMVMGKDLATHNDARTPPNRTNSVYPRKCKEPQIPNKTVRIPAFKLLSPLYFCDSRGIHHQTVGLLDFMVVLHIPYLLWGKFRLCFFQIFCRQTYIRVWRRI